MKQEILRQFPWTSLPSAALVIFLAIFIGVVIVTSLKSRKTIFVSAARLPLEDGIPQSGDEK